MSIFMITLSRAPWVYPPQLLDLDWNPKPRTLDTRTKVWRAGQIQYRLDFHNNGSVWVQGINIDHDLDIPSANPTMVSTRHVDVLKLFIAKRWILFDLYEDVTRKKKEPLAHKELSLLCAYILYYDKLMDHFLATRDDVLLHWLYIEKAFHGVHYPPPQPQDLEESVILDSNEAIQRSVALWGMNSIYNASGSLRGQNPDILEQVKAKVREWIRS